jgi:hypothetical protein
LSSVSLGRLQYEIELRLEQADESLRKLDDRIHQTYARYAELRKNLERPVDARVTLQDNGRMPVGGGGGGRQCRTMAALPLIHYAL